MKSHTDTASRSAVEVVTQLPEPARLGMLRFERLNTAIASIKADGSLDSILKKWGLDNQVRP